MLLKRIRFIVIIVTCSLLGIFLLQGYWLYNSYKLSAEQFDKEVAKIMQALRQKYVKTDMKKMGVPVDSLHTGKRIIGLERGEADSFFLSFDNSAADLPELPHLNLDDTSRRSVKFSIITHDTDSVKHDKVRTKFRKTEIFNVKDIYYSQQAFRDIAKPLTQDIDSLMLLNGINAPYALKFSNLSGLGKAYFTDSLLFQQLSPKLTNLKIGVLKPFYLDFSLNNNILFILRKMQWVLIASVFIISITSWAFLYMLRTIFQQKKLSDIKNDFFNNMTHEFKTPIATVSLAVEALKNREISDNLERSQEYLAICQHELKRISAMVDKVLKMAAFEKSEIALSLQQTNVPRLIESVVATMQPQLVNRQVELRVIASEGMPDAMLDRDHMANVFYNLIENSLKYTEKEPVIEISCKCEGTHDLQITVSDNGIGIPTAYQDKVFENFFRVPTGDIHNVKGFGMGLSYVSTIIKMHAGAIKLKSKLNEGSVFTITLPLKPLNT
jgi:two-component system phosphate regulon sensor histidine kinase PhoR